MKVKCMNRSKMHGVNFFQDYEVIDENKEVKTYKVINDHSVGVWVFAFDFVEIKEAITED